MELNLLFVLNGILFGVALAMDAFSVSVANGLYEPDMPAPRALRIAGTFGAFQTAMPLLGWLCVRTVAEAFQSFQRYIPYIALGLLLYLGIKMIADGAGGAEAERRSLRGWGLFMQGVATSIDALSVGFTIAEYAFALALAESLIIGAVTFGICLAGLRLGRRIGERVSGRATVAGGIILIQIGVEIFITGAFG